MLVNKAVLYTFSKQLACSHIGQNKSNMQKQLSYLS